MCSLEERLEKQEIEENKKKITAHCNEMFNHTWHNGVKELRRRGNILSSDNDKFVAKSEQDEEKCNKLLKKQTLSCENAILSLDRIE